MSATPETIESPHHSKEDALDEREFELLVEGAHNMDGDYFELEAKFIIFVSGRLGLRAGEIRHMRESWIDWRRRMILNHLSEMFNLSVFSVEKTRNCDSRIPAL